MLAPKRDMHKNQNFYAMVVLTGEDLTNEEKAATTEFTKQLNHFYLMTQTEREVRQ